MLFNFLYVICIFVGTLVCYELWLRFEMYYIKSDPYEIAMFEKVHPRIADLWLRGYNDRKYFWGPPYHVFLNRGLNNSKRMETIYKHSILPTGEWVTPNFLRSPEDEEASQYRVSVNRLGFRDQERSIKKPEKVFRIIVLGSYPAFGSGVSNSETYSFYLEKRLNSSSKNLKYEVWNGGQQGTTSISGYARLVGETMKYQPDLLIWDFGWVDLYFGEDFVKDPNVKNYRYSIKQRTLQWIWRNLTFLVSSRKIYHFFNRDFREVLKKDWKRVTLKALDFAKKNGLPVLLLKQRPVIIPDEDYMEISNQYENVHFVQLQDMFYNNKVPLTPEIKTAFWSRPNWLNEVGYKKDDEIPSQYYWRVDAIQLNRFAHKAVAEKLVDVIDEKIK